MTHGGVLARAYHANHGLVVVIEDEIGVFATKLLPKGNGRQSQASHSKVSRDNLGFRCRVTEATLPFAKSCQRKTSV